MRNKDVVSDFINGYDGSVGSNLYINGNTLVNYQTIIAIRIPEGIILNKDFYSNTTSVHQNQLRREGNILCEVYEEDLLKIIKGCNNG